MRRTTIPASTLMLLVLSSLATLPVHAETGTIDNVPAATLLLPRFEVDIDDPGGMTTLFSVNNASASPALAHVTIWTEFSVPVIDFDVYLTGFDVQTFNLRGILTQGWMPQTGEAVSNQGVWSTPGGFPGCNTGTTPGVGPVYRDLDPAFLQHIQEALSGQPMTLSGGLCASMPGNEGLMRGYITIDSVNDCSQLFPADLGYFVDGGVGTANNDNVLWGDYFICDFDAASAFGMPLVSIEADSRLTLAAGSCDPGDFSPTTFYCRYTAANGFPGTDNREALPSEFAVRYALGGDFDGGSELYVWRDPNLTSGLTTCGTAPFTMAQEAIYIFDEQENPTLIPIGGPSGQPPPEEQTPFPFETNAVVVGEDLTVDFNFGWLWLDLDEALATGISNQAWVTNSMSAEGRFSVGYDAIQLNNLTLDPLP